MFGSKLLTMAEHLDPETVEAFASRTLTARERARVFEHLVRCDRCREWVAVHAEVSRPPVAWRGTAMAAVAAGIACVGFALWLLSPRTVGEPFAAQKAPVDVTLGVMDADAQRDALLPAWRQVRLTPLVATPPPNQVSLKTTAGEKWIGVDSIGPSIVP